MNKNIIISVIAGVVVVGGVIWYFNSNSGPSPVYNPSVTNPPPLTSPQTAEPSMPPMSAPTTSPAPVSVNAGAKVLVGNVSVTISNYAYSPATFTIKKGTTVTWTNQDPVKHDVVSDTGTTLNSPYLATGESWSYTFNQTGTFSYHCIPHPWMKGTITVVQ